jgi:hypothetical protein
MTIAVWAFFADIDNLLSNLRQVTFYVHFTLFYF